MTGPADISQRKADHLEVAASGRADFQRTTTLLDDVFLVHQALPERAVDDIDLEVELFGKKLKAPLVIAGMTGGTAEAAALNRDLARAAERFGIAFGVGSQRAMAEHPELAATFNVRDAAPSVTLIGNLGAVQARALGVDAVARLCAQIGADALAIHLNPAMELIQPGGDRDFRHIVDTLGELAQRLEVPVIAKETGCGLSAEAAQAIFAAGIRTVDVSGAGGTSWVAVEAERAAGTAAGRLGRELWDWGIPTAVSCALSAREGLEVIATGGVRSGLDIARALALGARAGGMAAPMLRAHRAGGFDAVCAAIEEVLASIRAVVFLTGCGRAAELVAAKKHIGAGLRGWLADVG